MSWVCPFCNERQTVTGPKVDSQDHPIQIFMTHLGPVGARVSSICCSNPDCLRFTLRISTIKGEVYKDEVYIPQKTEVYETFQVLPESMARPQPDFIPAPIREDYLEACRIRDLSPKASATLSRRCLQGMIRDFCGISEKTLFGEIEKLRQMSDAGDAPRGVSDDSIDSLHHVRSLGNIGAHMEKDINLVVPVDPDEAQILIDLIETLFEEWYVSRERRQTRFAILKETAEAKQKLRQLPDESKSEQP